MEFLWELADIHISLLLHQKFQARPVQPTSSLSYKGFVATYDISLLSYPSHLLPPSFSLLPLSTLFHHPFFFTAGLDALGNHALSRAYCFFLPLSVDHHQRPKVSLVFRSVHRPLLLSSQSSLYLCLSPFIRLSRYSFLLRLFEKRHLRFLTRYTT